MRDRDLQKELRKGFLTSRVKFRPALSETNFGERAYLLSALAQQLVAKDGYSPAQVERYVRVSLQLATNAPKRNVFLCHSSDTGLFDSLFVNFKMRER